MANEVALIPYQTIERMADAAAKSGLFGVKNKDQALALMMVAQAEGMHPALAARDYHIINGKGALKADTMLARFQQSGGKVDWKDYTDAKVTGVFSHPQAGSVTIQWTIEQAKAIGLTSKDTWKNYPRAMLRARCISEGVRTCFPGVAVGTYTVEEVQDMEPTNITPEHRVENTAQTASGSATSLTGDEVAEHLSAMAEAAGIDALASAYAAALKHANDARDGHAKALFVAAKDARKTELMQPISTEATI